MRTHVRLNDRYACTHAYQRIAACHTPQRSGPPEGVHADDQLYGEEESEHEVGDTERARQIPWRVLECEPWEHAQGHVRSTALPGQGLKPRISGFHIVALYYYTTSAGIMSDIIVHMSDIICVIQYIIASYIP